MLPWLWNRSNYLRFRDLVKRARSEIISWEACENIPLSAGTFKPPVYLTQFQCNCVSPLAAPVEVVCWYDSTASTLYKRELYFFKPFLYFMFANKDSESCKLKVVRFSLTRYRASPYSQTKMVFFKTILQSRSVVLLDAWLPCKKTFSRCLESQLDGSYYVVTNQLCCYSRFPPSYTDRHIFCLSIVLRYVAYAR